jgi:hypothetical protein
MFLSLHPAWLYGDFYGVADANIVVHMSEHAHAESLKFYFVDLGNTKIQQT